MTMKTLMSIYAVTAMGFCLGLLALPAFWITLYGANADAQAVVLLRLTGALFGGLGVMAWRGRSAEPSKSRDALVLGLMISNGLAAVVAVLAARSGVYNQFAWGPVGTFALFAIAFLWAGRGGVTASASH
jgi:hypothetical protein